MTNTSIYDLNQFLNQKINQLTQNYDLMKKNKINYYTDLINKIKTSKISDNEKKKQITLLNIQLNSLLNKLLVKLNNDINQFKNYVASQKISSLPTSFNPNINKKNALLIGINYINTSYALNGCIKDTSDINNLLISQQFNSIQILTDKTSMKPTRTNIINQFTKLLQNSNSGDILFFQYSGHGSYVNDINKDELYTNYDETIVSSDFNLITDDTLKNIINTNLKPGVTLIALFDSCFNGSILD